MTNLPELQELIDAAGLVSINQAAKITKVSRYLIQDRIRDGELSFVKTAAGYLVSVADVQGIFKKKRGPKPSTKEAFLEGRSQRDKVVLEMVAAGKTFKEVAEELGITRQRVSQIYHWAPVELRVKPCKRPGCGQPTGLDMSGRHYEYCDACRNMNTPKWRYNLRKNYKIPFNSLTQLQKRCECGEMFPAYHKDKMLCPSCTQKRKTLLARERVHA